MVFSVQQTLISSVQLNTRRKVRCNDGCTKLTFQKSLGIDIYITLDYDINK